MADKKTSNDDTTGKGATPFINATTAVKEFEKSRNWYRRYHDPLDEFERIARGRPSPHIPEHLPKVTDQTMAAIVQEQPKRVVQQPTTGLVVCKDYPQYAQLASLQLDTRIVPNYNRNGSALQKDWLMLGKALTYGVSTSYTFFTMTNGVMHTDFVIPYIKDLYGEVGKTFLPDCNIRFMRSWYQKTDLQAIIMRENQLKSKDKKYKSEWDLELLQKFINDGETQKPADLQTPAEREKGQGAASAYEVIHAFQVGKGAEFYSFSPRFQDGKTLRTRINPDPRGKMPFDDLYCNIDLSNPLGRGQVEISGGVQNLIDQQMQMFQFMTTLEMGPPLQTWGTVNKKTLKFKPNAIWDMGTNQNNKVEPYAVSNFALSNFGNNYGLLKSQILNINSSPDNSISAESGNPTQSKTSAGVKSQSERLGVSDNYLRKQFEEWDGNQKETALNIYFAEMKGDLEEDLTADQMKNILKGDGAQYVDEKAMKVKIPYSKINDVAFKFQVDASSSEVKDNSDNADKLTEVYQLISQDPDPSIQEKKKQVLKLIIDEIGAEGTDDLFPEFQKDDKGNPINGMEQPQQPQMNQEMIAQMIDQALQQRDAQQPQEDPLLKIFKDLPEDVKQQMLQKYGYETTKDSPVERKLDIEAQNSMASAERDYAQQEQSQMQMQQQAMQSKEEAAESTDNPQTSPQEQPTDGPLEPEEEEIVEALLSSGYQETDAEQAITMLRQGLDENQIMEALEAKRG